MSTNHAGRLARLERLATPRERCWRCGNHPTRIVGIDAAGAMISETMPESGCPECGRPPVKSVEITGVDVAEAFPPPVRRAG